MQGNVPQTKRPGPMLSLLEPDTGFALFNVIIRLLQVSVEQCDNLDLDSCSEAALLHMQVAANAS